MQPNFPPPLTQTCPFLAISAPSSKEASTYICLVFVEEDPQTQKDIGLEFEDMYSSNIQRASYTQDRDGESPQTRFMCEALNAFEFEIVSMTLLQSAYTYSSIDYCTIFLFSYLFSVVCFKRSVNASFGMLGGQKIFRSIPNFAF